MLNNRGTITNRKRAKQQLDFHGLLIDSITPTDIDGLIEYKNKAYVIIEIKYGDAEMPLGQQIALERLTTDLERSGKPTITIVASHQTSNYNNDVNVAETIVRMYRYKGNWYRNWANTITTKELINKFLFNVTINAKELEEYMTFSYTSSLSKKQ